MSSPQKICVICGLDCSQITRYQSPDGGYYCQPCYDKISQRTAGVASPSLPPPPPPPSLRIAPVNAAPAPALPAPNLARADLSSRRVPSLKSPVAIAGGVLLAFAVILTLARFVPAASAGYFVACGLFALGVGIAVLVSAFRTSVVQGLLTLFVPFYSLYYVYGISRNKLLMTLTPLCLAVWLGIFLLPLDKAGFEITSESKAPGTQSAEGEIERNQPGFAGFNSDRTEHVVAGHRVAVSPRANASAYSKFSAGRRLSIKVGGKNVVFQSDQPLGVEDWSVGDQRVMVINNELIVNFRNYGALTPGAEILVNHGAVLVGGKPASESAGAVKVSTAP